MLVWNHLKQRIPLHHDREEVTQDVFQGTLPRFVDVLEQHEHFSGTWAWLRGITDHKVTDWRRKQMREPKRDASYDLSALRAEDPDWAEEDNESLLADVSSALKDLESEHPESHQVLVLKYLAEHSHEEIATLLKIKIDASRQRLRRALTFLRDRCCQPRPASTKM